MPAMQNGSLTSIVPIEQFAITPEGSDAIVPNGEVLGSLEKKDQLVQEMTTDVLAVLHHINALRDYYHKLGKE